MRKIRLRKQVYLIPLIIVGIIAVFIPMAFGLYRTKQESLMTTKFKLVEDYESVFVRAHIVTYWVDSTNQEIAFKEPWTLNESVVNSNWVKVDDFYYYKGTIPSSEITNGIPTEEELIDPSLEASSLSNEDLDNLKYIAKYKIVYDILEANEVNSVLSSEDAWGITYAEDGTPSKI